MDASARPVATAAAADLLRRLDIVGAMIVVVVLFMVDSTLAEVFRVFHVGIAYIYSNAKSSWQTTTGEES